MTNLQTQRQAILSYIERTHLYDGYDIGMSNLVWDTNEQAFMLTLPDDSIEWVDTLVKAIAMISDEDIEDFYNEEIAGCNPADFPGMTAEELKLYEVVE